MVRTKEYSFQTPLYDRVPIGNAKLKKRGNTHVYRRSKATSPSSVSIQRTCFRGRTISHFPHGGLCVQDYGSLSDLEETATVGQFPVTGHLKFCLSHRTSIITTEHTSRFVHVARELLNEYWHCR
jgi:hypothetical protein